MTEASSSSLRRVELVLGDRAEVAEHVREVDAERARVGAHALLLGEHGRVVLGLLEDPQRDPLLHVGGDRDGLVRRAVPAGAGDAALVAAGDQPGLDLPWSAATTARATRATQLVARAVVELAEQRAVERDHPGGAVGDQRAAHGVDDQAARAAARRSRAPTARPPGPGSLAADDLEVVEPGEEGREQREHQRLDDDQPQPPASSSWVEPSRRRRDACRGRLESGRGRRITTGSTNGVSSTSQSTATAITCSSPPMPTSRSPSSSPLSAKTEVPRKDDAATVATTTPALGRRSWRTRPATYPTRTRASAQRPATWSAGGARSSSDAADEAEGIANCGPRVSAGADDDEQGEVGHDAVPRRRAGRR